MNFGWDANQSGANRGLKVGSEEAIDFRFSLDLGMVFHRTKFNFFKKTPCPDEVRT